MRRQYSKSKKTNRLRKVIAYIMLGIVALTVIFIVSAIARFLLEESVWQRDEKLTLLVPAEDGGAIIGIIDPANSTLYRLYLPPETQLTAAYGLGVWKLGSSWKLGEQEGIGALLVRDSLISSLKFPIQSWLGEGGGKLLTGNAVSVVRSIFSNVDGNLSLKDKIKVARFAGSVSVDSVDINLVDSGYVTPQKLTDGSEGFVVDSRIPSQLVQLFSSPTVSAEQETIGIVDKTGGRYSVSDMTRVIEVLGTKVVSINRQEPENSDCEIRGEPGITLNIISTVFSCTKSRSSTEGNFDVEIHIGEAFADRF